MEKSISVEPGYSYSTSPISEPPDLANWFSSYVYESLPLSSSINESENEVDTKKLNLGVTDSNKDLNKPMYKKMNQNQISDSYESFPSEPPDLGNWFSSYVYESPMLDTSDGLDLLVHGESECLKDMGTNKDTTKIDRDEVPRLFEQELVSSTKVTDLSQFESGLSEPPDLRIWFSSYEYESPQLSELGFSSFEKDELIVEESDTEEGNSCGIFRKTKSNQEETIAPDKLTSNGCKENIATDMAKEVSSDNAYSDQEVENQLSVGLFNASNKVVKQESNFKQESILCEPRFIPGVSVYNPKHQSLSKNEDSLLERPKHIQETVSMNSNRQKSPRNQGSDDKENAHGQSTETGFVTMKKARFRETGEENAQGQSTETGFVTLKKARFRETRDQCSITKPNIGVVVGCLRVKELKKVDREEGKEQRKKKRKVLEEMSNHQSSGSDETAGKWRCPQKNKANIVPPLKQLRLDAWIHKV